MPSELPTVIATSVIRSAHQGQSHGGVYLVDLATEEHVQVVDWNDASISWEGRGGDRGLRGIAFNDGRILLAASDEIFVFDQSFEKIGSIRSRYLKHCHEIFVLDDMLHLTSTGFDSVLGFDLRAWSFVKGVCLRPLRLPPWRFQYLRIAKGLSARLGRLAAPGHRLLSISLRPRTFDPLGDDGPEPMDMLHINNVFADRDGIHVCGTELDGVFRIDSRRLRRVGTVPLGTHNARRMGDSLIYQDTAGERVVVRSEATGSTDLFRLPRYPSERLLSAHLERDHARQAFGRGLCLADDLVIAGSSPATLSVFRRGTPTPLKSICLTLDVRNAVHGLEVWPFDRRLSDWRARLVRGRDVADRTLAQVSS